MLVDSMHLVMPPDMKFGEDSVRGQVKSQGLGGQLTSRSSFRTLRGWAGRIPPGVLDVDAHRGSRVLRCQMRPGAADPEGHPTAQG